MNKVSQSALAARLNRLIDFSPVIIALALALVVSSVLLVALDADPLAAFSAMLEGSVGSENATAETLVKATPILFVGIGITIAFRGGMINIGGEGQMIAGALAGVTVALVLGEARVPAEMAKTPGAFDLIIVALSLLGGFLAGALYGGLAGFLKAYFDVNEILSTIMLNQIAVQMMNFLLNGICWTPPRRASTTFPRRRVW